MSKAQKPPKTPPVPTPSDDPGTPDAQPRCWYFSPDEPSAICPELNIGEAVRGNHIGSQIQINSERGFVGLVPKNETREIIEHVQATRKRLVGQVLSKDGTELILELCAI